jgi:hypothetical protein
LQGALRIDEGLESCFLQRVDADDEAAVVLALFERAEHARVVGAWVLANHQDEFGDVEVFERDTALADAECGRKRGSAAFVAHVGAVGEVVGAISAHKQLVHKCGLVACAAGGIKCGFIRGGQFLELSADLFEGIHPGDGGVVAAAMGEVHRLCDAAGLAKLIILPAGQLLDTVMQEKIGCDTLFCGLLSEGLGTVFTIFAEARPVAVRVGPGASAAIEAVFLIHARDYAESCACAHLHAEVADGLLDGVETCGLVFRWAKDEVAVQNRRHEVNLALGRFGRVGMDFCAHCALALGPEGEKYAKKRNERGRVILKKEVKAKLTKGYFLPLNLATPCSLIKAFAFSIFS